MNLHEYQSKRILKERGVNVPRGLLVHDGLEALVAARSLKTDRIVLKAQAHTGGRGKAGGVAVMSLDDDIRSEATRILGMNLVTNQTGPQGKPVSALLVEEAPQIDEELYLGVVLDRNDGHVTIMASPAGGMDIETIAKESPDKIYTVKVHPLRGLCPFQTRGLAYKLASNNLIANQIAKAITALYEIFVSCDCTLTEINPLIISRESVIALDAKINLDDHALFRRPEMASLRDRSQEDAVELSARLAGLSYIKLDGDIGCMVNGAGLAMATLDLISIHGGSPANFLDVGGGASEQVVADATHILLDDKRVRVVFINIFGGILRCDVLARGVIKAIKERGLELPVIARIEGTNIEMGRKLFADSGLEIQMIPSLNEAAAMVVAKAKELTKAN
ncbi:MAG: ADP-forming succinate--CoA ligase subunit beta [Desulfomonilaceae bacterium]